MASLTRTLRPVLRCVRSQTRSYAEASGNEMKFTFAGANQVSTSTTIFLGKCFFY